MQLIYISCINVAIFPFVLKTNPGQGTIKWQPQFLKFQFKSFELTAVLLQFNYNFIYSKMVLIITKDESSPSLLRMYFEFVEYHLLRSINSSKQ